MTQMTGAEFKAARKKLKLSYSEMSLFTGTSERTLRRWEDDKYPPNPRVVDMVLEALKGRIDVQEALEQARIRVEHPMPADWGWWASPDGGESFALGPYPERNDAIEAALRAAVDPDNHDFEPGMTVLIAECLDTHIDLAKWFSVRDFLERAAEEMDDSDCGANEHGDHPLDEIANFQKDELQAEIRLVIKVWQKRHALRLRSYWFEKIRNSHQIKIPIDESV